MSLSLTVLHLLDHSLSSLASWPTRSLTTLLELSSSFAGVLCWLDDNGFGSLINKGMERKGGGRLRFGLLIRCDIRHLISSIILILGVWVLPLPTIMDREIGKETQGRQLMGEGLSALGINQLKQLENQLQMSLNNVRMKKDQIFRDEIKELQRKGSFVHQRNEELHMKIDHINKENAELQKVIEARQKEEERVTLNPPHAMSNGYDILNWTNPSNLQQNQPHQYQRSEPPVEAMISGHSLKLMM
ncbi:hypothetical protein VNO78_11603 [Psophocarpus tetragonolobus]|uniref:K-box domain-containing protein n=1 Tax=Psophocarpus tetragonolobus TaxID=3891 RepID=A0AAN9SNH9_PSOTE